MITLLIALAAGAGGYFGAYYGAGFGVGWSITIGVVLFGGIQAGFGIALQKRVKADMERVQKILLEGQRKLQAKTQAWQFRPPGSIQAAQQIIFEDTKGFVRQALAETECLRRYRLWVPMIERQLATAKVQLHWMIKEFKQVDELMPKALMIDPTMVAIKLARMQMLGAPLEEITRVYNKGVRRLKYNQNVLIAATYSWILVHRGEIDAAFKALTAALKNSDDATLKANHEHLMNNRVAHFNNSGLGDQWYSLQLEEPKIRMQRPRSVYR